MSNESFVPGSLNSGGVFPRLSPLTSRPLPLRPAAVAFDFDGTLANTEDVFEKAGTELLARRGHAFDAAVRAVMIGKRADEAFPAMIAHLALTDTVEVLRAEAGELFRGHLAGTLALMPGSLALLDAVRAAGLPACVCSSSGRDYLAELCGRLNIADRFDFLLGAEDVTHGKPRPEIYETAAARLGVPVGRLLVLEDSATGCAAGVASGAVTVAVPNRHTAAMDFPGAAFVADGLSDPRIAALVG